MEIRTLDSIVNQERIVDNHNSVCLEADHKEDHEVHISEEILSNMTRALPISTQSFGIPRFEIVSISIPVSSPSLFLNQVNINLPAMIKTVEPCLNCLCNPIEKTKETMPFSRSMTCGVSITCVEEEAINRDVLGRSVRDKRFDHFKTWSGGLERQLSHLIGNTQESEFEISELESSEDNESFPVDRFYDAFSGPELEGLKESEELVLPKDQTWPFLLRFPITAFGICLGVSSQAILWKTLAASPSTKFLNISPSINHALWFIAIAALAILSSIYILKIIFYFEAVRREYYHPIRVNFFFAPWVACLFLALGVPSSVIRPPLPKFIWYVLMAPILCLELKIYGQWMSGGKRRLSQVANPTNQLAIVGNFVGALLGASIGLHEGPLFFFAVGLVHYTVLFVTLYQRLPTNETLPKELHPVFFLFVAPPSVASMAWATIQGEFGYGSKISYFTALFLYASLAIRLNFFRGFRFSFAWWAYTFPMTGAAVATIKYANQVQNAGTQILSVVLSAIAAITVTTVLLTTLFHAFVLQGLFPNDNAIAISHKKIDKKEQQETFIHIF